MPENQLTNSELGVNNRPKGAQINPIVSTPGVNMGLNIVNMVELTPIFPVQAWIGNLLDKKAIRVVKVQKKALHGLRSEC